VNAGRIRVALEWLKNHNRLYRDAKINEECLCELEENPVLPFSAEHILPSAANEAATACYDSIPGPSGASPSTPRIFCFRMLLSLMLRVMLSCELPLFAMSIRKVEVTFKFLVTVMQKMNFAKTVYFSP
jgi:hypothetical protein